MKTLLTLAVTAALAGCTGSREMYNNNGLRLLQVGADPTPFNGGYNLIIAEQNGESSVVAVDATGTVLEQVSLPGSMIGSSAIRRPDRIEVSSGGGRDPRVNKLVHTLPSPRTRN